MVLFTCVCVHRAAAACLPALGVSQTPPLLGPTGPDPPLWQDSDMAFFGVSFATWMVISTAVWWVFLALHRHTLSFSFSCPSCRSPLLCAILSATFPGLVVILLASVTLTAVQQLSHFLAGATAHPPRHVPVPIVSEVPTERTEDDAHAARKNRTQDMHELRERFLDTVRGWNQRQRCDALRKETHDVQSSVEEVRRAYQAHRDAFLISTTGDPDHTRHRHEVTDAARRLEQLERQLRALQRNILFWENTDSAFLIAHGARAFDDLLGHPRVTALAVSKHTLVIDLATTVIPFQGKLYEIGDFSLHVGVCTGTFSVSCRRRAGPSAGVHPFWFCNSICFGDAASVLHEFLLRLDLYGFVDFAVRMMSKPSEHMKGKWPEVSHEP